MAVPPSPRSAKTLSGCKGGARPRRAAAVTVASRTLESQVWGFGVAPGQVFYLPNGVDRMENAELRIENHFVRDADSQFTLLLYTRFWELDVRDVVAWRLAVLAHG